MRNGEWKTTECENTECGMGSGQRVNVKRWKVNGEMKTSGRPFFLNLTLILLLILILPASPASAQYFTINRYHSDIEVKQDSSITVAETIEVQFTRPRHGIYREIPFKYQTDLGKVIRTPLNVISVTDGSGRKWKYKASKTGHVVNIRIGDPDKLVSGTQTYVITYQVENVILFLQDHDELYWNVTGNHWKGPIREASADVRLAVKDESRKSPAACYTGVYGSNESECSFEASGNQGRFMTRKGLRTAEGLTIAFGWDKGLVTPPSSWKKFLWAIDFGENWVFLLPLFSLAIMVTRWRRRGRDPKVRESIAVQYEPPKFENRPLTPAEVGTLVDEKVDQRDITSSIVGLGVKGYLQFEETKREGLILDKKDYRLKKLKEPDSNLGPFETELMKSLFPSGPATDVSDLKNRFYAYVPVLKKMLYGDLVRKRYFAANPERVRGSYVAAGFVIAIFGSLALLLLAPGSVVKGVVASLLTAIPVFAFAKAMPAKTREGALAYAHILGFQEFMNRAEKDKLERMGDTELFSKYLPYAMALDVVDRWAKAFQGIYQDPPDWYVSPAGFTTFSPYGFSHSVGSMTSSLASVVFSAPRGSGIDGGSGGGGGGGGFSGGGSGGGGGGDW
jgi:uncharacterized membrane protein YgcG